MIASLPMYDTPATAAANDRFWAEIRQSYGHGPTRLERNQDPHDTWASPELVFSQTCGLPFRSGLYRSVQLVGTPDYGVADCPPGYYNSCIVVRADDPRQCFTEYGGVRLARNDRRSQSGWAAILEHARAADPHFRFEENILDTGSHAFSVQAVARGEADIAAIDAITWALLVEHSPTAGRLRVLERTRPTPGLPFITGSRENAKALFDAVSAALSQLSEEDRACLQLKGIVKIPAETYREVPLP